MQASLGGGGGFEGFYGSVTANGVSRVYESMSEHCAFGKDSFLVDIGGGVGRYALNARTIHCNTCMHAVIGHFSASCQKFRPFRFC